MREVLRPPNQLPLGEAELAEEVGRSLTAGNPSAPANIVRYSARERGYRADPIIDQQLQHLSLGGCLVHRDSDDAARERQRRDSGALAAHSRRATAQLRRVTMRPSEAGGLRAEASTGPAPLMPIPSSLGGAAGLSGEDSTRLRNQFNFADRAAQTGHAAPRERGSQTEPPPTATASGSCSRSEMFEAYIQDQDRQRQMEELARQKAAAAHREARAQQAAARQGSQQPGAGGAAAVLPGLDQVGVLRLRGRL